MEQFGGHNWLPVGLVFCCWCQASWALTDISFAAILLSPSYFAMGIMIPIDSATVSIWVWLVELNLDNTLPLWCWCTIAQGLLFAVFLSEFVRTIPRRNLRKRRDVCGTVNIRFSSALFCHCLKPAMANGSRLYHCPNLERFNGSHSFWPWGRNAHYYSKA